MKSPHPFSPRRCFILTSTIAALLGGNLAAPQIRAANVWDGGGPNGNWSTALNWDNNLVPAFPQPLTFAGTTNLDTNNDLSSITVNGITFDQPAETFTLGGNAITLSGAINQNSTGGAPIINLPMVLSGPQTVSVIEDGVLTIGPGENGSGVISGGASLTKTGQGSLRLGAVNTYTGDTILDGGGLMYAADNTVANLIFGAAPTPPFSETRSELYLLDASLTASSLAVRTNNTLANAITIGSGRTLTINGAVSVGPNTSGLGAAGSGAAAALGVTGAGSFVVAGTGHFSVGLPRLNTDPNPDPFSTVDLSGLSNFTYDAGASTGELRVGGGNVRGTLNLAFASNTIVAAAVRVGDSGVTSGGGGNNNGGTSTLSLGGGTNIINANSLVFGAVKSAGILNFQGPDGSVIIAGRAGGTANITVGNASIATHSGSTSQLLLAGHDANVQAGTVIIGQLAGSTGGQGAGNVTFSTGTFNIVNLQMAVHSSGSAALGTTANLTIGNDPGDSATGVFNVTNQFLLVNRTTGSGTVANSNFTINGGTVNVNADILIIDNSPGASRSTSFTLAGGTLNMMGHAIASAEFPIDTVTITSPGTGATLANLGGTGINGAGLNVNGGSTLTLEGANTYTGGTVIEASRLEVGTGGLTGTLPAGDVTNNGILVFNRAGALTVSSPISGTGRVEQIGSGTVTLSGASTFAGPTEINAGALVVTGSIGSNVDLNAGTLAGAGDGVMTGKVGNVTMDPGSNLRPGTTGLLGDAGTLTLAGLTVLGGDLQFDLGATSDLVNVTGTANFAGASTITPNPAAPAGTYTVLTAGTLTLGVTPTLNAPGNTRKTFTANYATPNTIKLIVAGASKSLMWTGATNGVWNVGTSGTLNWTDGTFAEQFFNADAVTFGNGPANRNVTIAGLGVLPASVTVNNIAGNDYAFSGEPIGGGAALTKSGAGALTLASANTYSGGTTLNAGTMNINHASALGVGTLTINGGTLDNTSGAPVTLAENNAQTWNASFAFAGTNNLNLGVGDVTLTTAPAITVNAGTLTVGGSIRGNFGLTKGGSGTLVLAGANTYDGNTHLSTGTLALNSPSAIGTGTFSIGGGGTIDNTSGADVTLVTNNPQNWQSDGVNPTVINFTGTNNLNLGTGTVTLGTNPTVQVGANTLTVGGVISDALGNSITKSGAGTLVLAGANAYTGATNINAGTLRVTNSSSLGDPAGAVNIAPGAALDLAGSTTANSLNFGFKQFNIAGTGVGGTGALTNSGATAQLNAFQHVTLTADATVGGTGRFDIRSQPTSSLSTTLDLAGHTLTKNGSNQFTLVGTDVSDGSIVVNQGVFAIETVSSVLDTGSGHTITYNAGTTAQFFNLSGPVTRPMVFNGSVTVGNASGAAQPSTVGSNMTLNGDLTVTNLNGSAGALTLTGNLTETGGPHSITKNGPTLLVLSGNNSYSGGTILNAGILQMGSATALGAATSNLTVNGGTLDLNAQNLTVGALSGTGGTITSGGGSVTLITNTSTATTFAGAIENGFGTLILAKQGSGMLTLSGAQSYAALSVEEGTLNLNSPLLNATINSTGGVLNVNADVSGSTVDVTAAVGTAVTNFTVSQTLAALSIGNGGVATLTEQSPAVAAGVEVLDAHGLPASEDGALAGSSLQAVPEPGSLSLLLIGALALLGRRRAS